MNKVLFYCVVFALVFTACSTAEQDIPPTLSPAQAKGKAVFSANCASCHTTAPDLIVVGPSLAGIASRAGSRIEGYSARQYIENSILFPDNYTVEGFEDLMPKTFGKTLSSEDFDALIEYLMSLD